jgi:hypothetical protein
VSDQRSTTRRGLQDIRTLSGATGRSGGANRSYAQLAALAMELQRREHEQEMSEARAKVAMRRARTLERDIGEILDRLRTRVGVDATTNRSTNHGISIRYGAAKRRSACTEGSDPA